MTHMGNTPDFSSALHSPIRTLKKMSSNHEFAVHIKRASKEAAFLMEELRKQKLLSQSAKRDFEDYIAMGQAVAANDVLCDEERAAVIDRLAIWQKQKTHFATLLMNKMDKVNAAAKKRLCDTLGVKTRTSKK